MDKIFEKTCEDGKTKLRIAESNELLMIEISEFDGLGETGIMYLEKKDVEDMISYLNKIKL